MSQDKDIEEYRREAMAWTLRLKPGIATTDDIAAFERWCRRNPAHARAFIELRELWDAVGPAGQRLFDPKALEDIAATRGTWPVALGRRAFLTGAAAASVAAVAYAAVDPPLHLWPSIAELGADYRTATGEQRRIALPDDIAIEMNTQTSIGLRPVADGAHSIELIAGEGVVRVQSHALEVFAADGRVGGTNAAFNIRRDGNKVNVTCLQGEVSVVWQTAPVMLSSQRQVSYSRAGLTPVSLADSAAITSWREGFLVFHDTRLSDVIAEINRYRQGRIVIVNEALGQRTVDGRFYLTRLDDVVEKVRNTFGAHVTSLPGGVTILS